MGSILALKKTKKKRARRFANNFRFIDDLRVLNYGAEFERGFREIYPPELKLKKGNDINIEGFFLGVGIFLFLEHKFRE